MPTPADDQVRLELLHELGVAFAARLELDELIPLVITRCRGALDCEGGNVLLLDATGQELYFPYVGEDPQVDRRLTELRVPADRGIVGAALREGRVQRVDDAHRDPRHNPAIDRETGVTTRALIALPLLSRQGPLGVLTMLNPRHGGPFSDADLAFLEVLAGSVAVAIENAQIYARLKDSEAGLRAQVGALRRDLARCTGFPEIVATGAAMTEVFRLMESAANSPIAVLVEGETGTGKELVARGIHRAGPRAPAPFVAVNCAALPETLLESELFGHRRGAFTGALTDQQGLFEVAAGGTIFLDEISEMPAVMQAKLLRVLQEGEVRRVGDPRPRQIDVRVISATNRDLIAEVKAHRFREDLFYRLAAFPIRLPPLRDRRFDVPVLADRFLATASERHRKRVAGIDPEAVDALAEFDWPGNVRELENEIARAVALVRDGETIGLAHLSPKLVAGASAVGGGPAEAGAESLLRPARAAFERRHIARVLKERGGNVSHAATALGLSRAQLQKKMKEYGLR